MQAQQHTHTTDSRLPWRVVGGDDGWSIWTRFDDTPGSRNNYKIAEGIQTTEDAVKLAAAPQLLEALRNLLTEFESRTALIESCDLDPDEEKAMESARDAIAAAEGK